MCLIHSGPSAQVRSTLLNTKGMIADIYASNSDGLGVMYKNKKGLRIVKTVPKSLDEVTRLIDQLPQDDRMVAMHWRMKTHGDIDITNCHPYDVLPGKLAMMHNGVLHTGNDGDLTKSDTWHFIKDYLAGPMALCKDLAHSPEFIEMLENFIDDNRFVFMDDEGRLSIVNKDQGVEHDGMWFSNTYAWTPSMLIPGYAGMRGRYYGGWDAYDADWNDYYAKRYSAPDNGGGNAYHAATHALCSTPNTGTALTHYSHPKSESRSGQWSAKACQEFIDAVMDGEVGAVGKALGTMPFSAIGALEERYVPRVSRSLGLGGEDMLSDGERDIVKAALQGGLAFKAHSHPLSVADVICYYLEWDPRADDEEVPYEADEADDDECGEYTYCDYRIRVNEEDRGYFGYATFDANLHEVDSGYGYESVTETLRWASSWIDARARDAAVARAVTEEENKELTQ